MVTVKFHINCDPKTTSYPGSIMDYFLMEIAPLVNSAISVSDDATQEIYEGIVYDPDIEIFKKMIGINEIPFESGMVSIQVSQMEPLLALNPHLKKDVPNFLNMLQLIKDSGENQINLIVQIDPPLEKFIPQKVDRSNIEATPLPENYDSLPFEKKMDYIFSK